MLPRYASLLVFVLLWASAQAQPEPRTLEGVRQDLQDIKASKAEITRPRVELPSISGPELPAASSPMPSLQARDSQAAVRVKSANWLLDAMSGTAVNTEEEEKLLLLTGEKTETELQLEKRFRLPGEKTGKAPSGLHKKPVDMDRNFSSQLTIENPLTAFMGDWISQRDHALLLRKATSDSASNRPLVSLSAITDYRGAGMLIGTSFSADRTAAPTNAFSLSTPTSENPYLQTLLPPLPESPTMGPDVSALGQPRSDPRSVPINLRNEPSVTAGKPPVPAELAKPEDDKKYFPQLRRF